MERYMLGAEKFAVVCPYCRKPTKTGFTAEIETLRANLGDRNKVNDYKTKCQGCGEWVFWSKAQLIPERLLNGRSDNPN
jgi:endogenous inhibitor of DNA gyrase (YacG/DUF329 family)